MSPCHMNVFPFRARLMPQAEGGISGTIVCRLKAPRHQHQHVAASYEQPEHTSSPTFRRESENRPSASRPKSSEKVTALGLPPVRPARHAAHQHLPQQAQSAAQAVHHAAAHGAAERHGAGEAAATGDGAAARDGQDRERTHPGREHHPLGPAHRTPRDRRAVLRAARGARGPARGRQGLRPGPGGGGQEHHLRGAARRGRQGVDARAELAGGEVRQGVRAGGHGGPRRECESGGSAEGRAAGAKAGAGLPRGDCGGPSGGIKVRALEAELENEELSRATPPRDLGPRSPVSVMPPSPSTDNIRPKVNLPGPPELKPNKKMVEAKQSSGPGGKIPDVNELAARFAQLKR
nr:hypothetical protein CFP56_19643 [Quercus suber]